MVATEAKSTSELVTDARHAVKAAQTAISGCNRAKKEVAETITYIRWWRFFGYDARALDFLEKLEMRDEPVAVSSFKG